MSMDTLALAAGRSVPAGCSGRGLPRPLSSRAPRVAWTPLPPARTRVETLWERRPGKSPSLGVMVATGPGEENSEPPPLPPGQVRSMSPGPLGSRDGSMDAFPLRPQSPTRLARMPRYPRLLRRAGITRLLSLIMVPTALLSLHAAAVCLAALAYDALTGLSLTVAKTFTLNMLRLVASDKGDALVRRDELRLLEASPRDVLELLPGAIANDLLGELLAVLVRMQNAVADGLIAWLSYVQQSPLRPMALHWCWTLTLVGLGAFWLRGTLERSNADMEVDREREREREESAEGERGEGGKEGGSGGGGGVVRVGEPGIEDRVFSAIHAALMHPLLPGTAWALFAAGTIGLCSLSMVNAGGVAMAADGARLWMAVAALSTATRSCMLLAHAGALSMHATCPGHPRRAWRGVPRAVLGLTGGLTLLSGGELMARLGDVKAFAMHALRIPPTREGTPLRSLLILALFTLCMRPMPLRRDGRPSRAMAGTWPAQVALGVLWMVASHGLDLP